MNEKSHVAFLEFERDGLSVNREMKIDKVELFRFLDRRCAVDPDLFGIFPWDDSWTSPEDGLKALDLLLAKCGSQLSEIETEIVAVLQSVFSNAILQGDRFRIRSEKEIQDAKPTKESTKRSVSISHKAGSYTVTVFETIDDVDYSVKHSQSNIFSLPAAKLIAEQLADTFDAEVDDQ